MKELKQELMVEIARLIESDENCAGGSYEMLEFLDVDELEKIRANLLKSKQNSINSGYIDEIAQKCSKKSN